MAIMYLPKENCTCPKGQIMNELLSLALTVLIIKCKLFENSMKPDINLKTVYIQIRWLLGKPADQDQHCFPNNMQV